MESFQFVLVLSLPYHSCDQREESQGQILYDLHDPQACAQQAWLYEHRHSGDDHSAKYGDAASQKGSRHPSDPFNGSEFCACLQIHHENVGQKNKSATGNDHETPATYFIYSEPHDWDQDRGNDVRKDQVDSRVLWGLYPFEHFLVVLVTVVQERNEQSLAEHCDQHQEPESRG